MVNKDNNIQDKLTEINSNANAKGIDSKKLGKILLGASGIIAIIGKMFIDMNDNDKDNS